MTSVRGRVSGGVVLLDDSLPEGAEVEVQVRAASDAPVARMKLTTEKSGDVGVDDVQVIRKCFDEKNFGGFAILEAADGKFLQTARSLREPVKGDPWILEYREGPEGPHYESVGVVTLLQVKGAFLAYLRGDQSWRTSREWRPLEL